MAKGVSRLRGDLGTLRALKNSIAGMPVSLSHAVAARVAPELTSQAQASYDAGVTVYGTARPASIVDGHPLDLVQSGAVRRDMKFNALGTKVTVTLGPRYAKYLVGKYVILPIGDRSAIPAPWVAAVDRIVKEEADKYVASLPRSA
jgi:hypothetical protein